MRTSSIAAVVIGTAVSIACGSSSPAAPSAPVTVTAPTPPAPVFPSLAGAWTGTVAVTLAVLNHDTSITNVCDATWTNTQTAGTFSGAFVWSGGKVAPCSGGLTYQGTVTTAGAVNVDLIWPFDDATCGLTSIQTLAGTVSGRSWTMTQKDTWLCENQTIQVDRTILVELTR